MWDDGSVKSKQTNKIYIDHRRPNIFITYFLNGVCYIILYMPPIYHTKLNLSQSIQRDSWWWVTLIWYQNTGIYRDWWLTLVVVFHDEVIEWKHFPRHWPFAGNANSPHKGQWRGALMFSLICALNKRMSKQSWGWWCETPPRSLWRHCNVRSGPTYWIYDSYRFPKNSFKHHNR